MRQALTLMVLLLCTGTAAAQENVIVITNGTIIDGTGASPITGHALVIVDNRIAGLYETALYDPPPNAQFIDAEGGAILPGFFNAHTHFTEEFTERRDNHLAYGVTSICNLDTSFAAMPMFDVMREGGLLAARGFVAGPMVAVEGGYPTIQWGDEAGYNIVGPEAAGNAVNELAANGADFIKISLEPGGGQNPEPLPMLTLEEVRAVVEAAHENGLQVISHVEDAGMLNRALDGGVDIITHTPYRQRTGNRVEMIYAGSADEPQLSDELDANITRMVEQRVMLIPTIQVLQAGQSVDTVRVAGMLEFIRRFHERGGVIALGNDYPLGATRPGIPIPEMELLMQAGLSEMDVIVAGTQNAAVACGHGDELGTLEEGKLADVIIVAGNPLENIHALENVQLVILDGEIAFDHR